MKNHPKTEFYSDHAVNGLEKSFKVSYKFIWWIWSTVFWVVFLGLWFLPKEKKQILTSHGEELLEKITVSHSLLFLLALLPFWLWMVEALLVWGIGSARRFFLYPKADFTESATVRIEKKEHIKYPQSRGKTLHSYFLYVIHPLTHQLMQVEIGEKEVFDTVQEGSYVRIKHLLTPANILYLTVPGE
jgi:hypothetical protein